MKNAVFWDVAPRGFRLLVTANIVSSSPIFATLMMEAICPSETSILTKATRVTSQKTAFFMDTAVKTSNLIKVDFISFYRFNFVHSTRQGIY
jgi:hypothetical protein